MPFVSLYIFKLLKEKDLLILRIFFSASAVLLFLVFLIDAPAVRLVLFTISLMCCSVSSSTLWSIYIPNIGKSGKVSSANGIIDCIGYVGASVFNVAVVPIMDAFGWGGTILSWCGIMLVGVASTLFATTKKENN
jgi:sugar phosphate permease